MREAMFDDPKSWLQTTFDNDQLKLQALERRVKEYFLELEKKYQVINMVIPTQNINLNRICVD